MVWAHASLKALAIASAVRKAIILPLEIVGRGL